MDGKLAEHRRQRIRAGHFRTRVEPGDYVCRQGAHAHDRIATHNVVGAHKYAGAAKSQLPIRVLRLILRKGREEANKELNVIGAVAIQVELPGAL